MEGVLVAVGDDCVAGVSTAVESRTDVIVLGQDVNQLAFALVAPLGAQDDGET